MGNYGKTIAYYKRMGIEPEDIREYTRKENRTWGFIVIGFAILVAIPFIMDILARGNR